MARKSDWMHLKLYRIIGNELPCESQLFKSFIQGIPFSCLSPSDKAKCSSAEDVLNMWEIRGGIGPGNYELLLKLLHETELRKVLDIAKKQIDQIMAQLSIENETSTNLAERTPGLCKEYLSCTDPTKIPDHTEKIQLELQDWYIYNLSLLRPILSFEWREYDLDHVFTNLEMVPGRKNQYSPRLNSSCDDIPTLSSLFNRESNKRSICFVEGPAGIGKSTLCRRAAYLWSKNNCSINEHHFDLLFLLEANSLTGNLKKTIKRQLFAEDFDVSEDNIYECLHKNQNRCLLIIDGVDELTSEGKVTVSKLLKGDNLRHVNLLLTGRPEASREFIKYANSHLQITGFSFENVEEYICKYFGSSDNNLKEMLLGRVRCDRRLLTIMKNPFTTLLVCILVKENKEDIPTNLTDVLNLVLQTRCQNYITNKEGGGILFNEENMFSAAGHLAYSGLEQGLTAYSIENIASFCPDGFSEHLLKSGILSKDFTVSRIQTNVFCYFPHKSFQEFLCAKLLAELDFGEYKEKLELLIYPFRGIFINMNLLMVLLEILQCPVKIQVVLESICHKIEKEKMFDGLTMSTLLTLCREYNKLLAQVIITCTCHGILKALFSLFCYCQYIPVLYKECISRMKLPPVLVIVSDTTFGTEPCQDNFESFNIVTCKPFISHNMKVQFPHHIELLVDKPSFLRKREFLDISWPFCHCCSIKAANDILTKRIKVSVLTILLIPGNDSVEDTTALTKHLTSTQNKVAVLLVVVEDLDNEYFLRMVSLFSSFQNISFLKKRCASVKQEHVIPCRFLNKYIYGLNQYVTLRDDVDAKCHVFHCSIIQMYYSKCCPY